MAFTYVDMHKDSSGTNWVTTLAQAATMNIAAGDLLIFFGSHPMAATITGVTDGGSNTFTLGTNTQSSTIWGRFGYILSASANASATFTATMSTGCPVDMYVYQFRPSSTYTVTLDPTSDNLKLRASSGGSLLTDDFTTMGANTVCVCAYGGNVPETLSVQKINEVSADGVDNQTRTAVWYRIISGAYTGHGQATRTQDYGSTFYLCGFASFKEASGRTRYPFPSYKG